MKKGESAQDYFIFNVVCLEDYEKGRFEGMRINYHYYNTHLGRVLIATDPFGVFYVAFTDEMGDEEAFFDSPIFTASAEYYKVEDEVQHQVIDFLSGKTPSKKIALHVEATSFQIKVWNELLKIPFGCLKSYKDIAVALNNPRAARAVGTAVANNPIAFLIPCHRVVRTDGKLGDYRWGVTCKKRIVAWESQF